jgi:hypothetical protein
MISITVCLALLCALMLGGLTTVSAASAPGTSFIKTYGGSGYDTGINIQQVKDGSYVFSAISLSNDKDFSGNKGSFDGWVVKLDTAGKIKWKRCIGDAGLDIINSIQQTKDGGFVVAGTTASSDGIFSGNHGAYDAWVIKLNAAGSIQWTKCYGGSDHDDAQRILQTADGGYIFTGNCYSFDGDGAGSDSNAWVAKLDSAGKIQWQSFPGIEGTEEIYNIFLASDGSYIICGGSIDEDTEYFKDAYIAKLTQKGALAWQKTYGGSGADMAQGIVQAYDGSFVFSGLTYSKNGNVSGNHGDADMWVFNITGNGTLKWSKCFGGSAYDLGSSISRTLDGGYILAGMTESKNGNISGAKGKDDVWLAKLSSTGAIQWAKTYGGKNNDTVATIAQTKDGGYVLTGDSDSKDGDFKASKGSTDAFVMKLKRDTLYKKPSLASISAAKYTNAAGGIAKFKGKLTTTANAALKLTIYNDKGKIVAILTKATQFSGSKEFIWDGKATAGNTAKLKTGAKVPIAKTGTSFKYKLTAANVVGSTDSKSFTVKLYS